MTSNKLFSKLGINKITYILLLRYATQMNAPIIAGAVERGARGLNPLSPPRGDRMGGGG